MGIGDALKANADSIRDALGSDCTLNGVTALGKCSLNLLNGIQAREALGDDFGDEQDKEWAMIEVPAGRPIQAQDRITVDTTGRNFVVRRVSQPTVSNVVIASRCLCVAG